MLLQQCLPFTVLKLGNEDNMDGQSYRCNSAYRLRYWNLLVFLNLSKLVLCCNSAYRLRYWNQDLETSPLMKDIGCNSAYRLRYWNDDQKDYQR